MMLHFNPFQIFTSSQTPVGLYARQKWLGEEKTSKWQADFQACVNGLFKNQAADGSWDQNPLTTIKRLFGLQDDTRVLDLYHRLSPEDPERPSWLDDWASRHNILRALVVHPTYSDDDVTQSAVERLAALQTEDGEWGNDLPCFQTLNALAHLTSPQAEKQLERAFPRVLELQETDGTFSRLEPEWNTFLTVHALKNKGLI